MIAALSAFAGLCLPAEGAAYNWYYELVTARYPLNARTRSCVVCHTRAGSLELNPYGREFLESGADSRALAAISSFDSDSDGASNEVELRTGHFPGDPVDTPPSAEVVALRSGRPITGDREREIIESLQCPCCDKLVMNCKCEMVPEIQRLVHQGVAAGRKTAAIRESLVARYGPGILPIAERAGTLPADRFADPRVANAYRIAATIPGELEKYPCFCACYRANGHLSLLDCFKNQHGARCAICIAEAEVVDEMVKGRKPDLEVRGRILAQFGRHD